MFKGIRGIALALVALLALGAMSALAGAGPVGQVAGVVTGDNDEGPASVHQTNGDEPQGTEKIAEAIAEEFAGDFAADLGLTEEQAADQLKADVLALHDDGIGFGAIYKLYQLAVAKEMTVEQLLMDVIGTNEDGGHPFAFGQHFRALTEDELARLDGLHRNLGQAVSSQNHEQSSGEVAASETEPAGGSSKEKSHGPPAFAKAHGRR